MRNILPPLSHDPGKTRKLTAKAELAFKRRLKGAYKQIVQLVFRELNPIEQKVNQSQAWVINSQRDEEFHVNDKIYTYELSKTELMRLYEIIGEVIDRWLMVDKQGNIITEFNPEALWFFHNYVEVAYERGTEQARIELAAQSASYAALMPTLQSVLYSEPYQRRIGYVAAREFEEMKGFTDDVKKAARQVLSDAIGQGMSPRWAARQLMDRIEVVHGQAKNPVDIGRAYRIAQTEIGMAHRQSKQDEARNADHKYGIKSLVMSISAFMKTSRKWHMGRHGDLFTYEEQREFYSKSKNSVNCHCSQVVVIVDDFGKPLSPNLIKRASDQKKKMQEKFGEKFD